jgi:hypothetical protein
VALLSAFAVSSTQLANIRRIESHEVLMAPQLFDASGESLKMLSGMVAIHQLVPSGEAGAYQLGASTTLRLGLPGWILGNCQEHDACSAMPATRRLAQDARLTFATPVFESSEGALVVPTSDLLVGIADGVSEAHALEQLMQTLNLLGVPASIEALGTPASRMRRIRTELRSGLDVLSTVASLAKSPLLRFVETDVIIEGRSSLIPNDTIFSTQWGLHNTGQSGGNPDIDLDLPEAWDITTGTSSIRIAIIDVGVEQTHPDINQLPGIDVTNQPLGDGGPQNANDNHGTAVAGCATAIIDNGIGIAGVAPDCLALSIRTMVAIAPDGSWNSQASWTVDALVQAQILSVRVTNNSNWYGFSSAAINTEYDTSRTAGLVHFASAGNFGVDQVSYPGRVAGVNAVAAVNRNGNKTSFSSYGAALMFTAPGKDIDTTDRTGADGYIGTDYVVVDGTSFASPYVASVAALVLSQTPTLTAAQVEQILRVSALDLGTPGFDDENGWGLPNALRSLQSCGQIQVCSASLNTNSTVCQMGLTGSVSVTANDLELVATGAMPTQPGLFFYGTEAVGTPFGEGLLCVQSGGSGLHRLNPVTNANGAGLAEYVTDYNAVPMNAGAGLVQSGATWTFQYWYRDPFTASGFNLSDGLSITFCP